MTFNSFTDLRGFRVRAADEPEGTVDDLYVDDAEWKLRYLVVDVGFWIFGHRALIGADLLEAPDVERSEWPVRLSAQEIRDAPRPQTDPPVSTQREDATRRAAGVYPPFLVGWAGTAYTPLIAEQQVREMQSFEHDERRARETGMTGDPHLRSLDELTGYDVHTREGEAGTVADFLLNPLDWTVRYLVVDTGRWLPGRRAVLATSWIGAVDWAERRVTVDVQRQKIESAPEPQDLSSLKRSDEEALFGHYAATPYWV